MIHPARLFSKQGQNKDAFRQAKQRQFTIIRRHSEELLQIIEKENFHKEDKTCKKENSKALANMHIKPHNY